MKVFRDRIPRSLLGSFNLTQRAQRSLRKTFFIQEMQDGLDFFLHTV